MIILFLNKFFTNMSWNVWLKEERLCTSHFPALKYLSSDFNNISYDSFLWKLIFHIYIPMYFTQNPSVICKKTLSYVKFSVNQKPNIHFYGNYLCKTAIWSIIIVTWERNNGETGLRTHGRNTNVITISSYLLDLELENVHSLK